jgi:hypothetical protein
MLSYTMSEDGLRAHIESCKGGFIRLSIIRICRDQGWEMPPETLDETTDLETLKMLNFDLQARREFFRRKRQEAEREKKRERERRLPPDIAAKVAELREYAASIREAALRADRNADMRRELAKAKRIEADASALIDSVK